MGPVATALRGVCRGWQAVRAGRPSPCRFQPSCSQYAIEALEAHGALRGSWLSAKRIGRCNPWGPFGYDPVPLPAGAATTDLPLASRSAGRGASQPAPRA
jgi:hypothetical protein